MGHGYLDETFLRYCLYAPAVHVQKDIDLDSFAGGWVPRKPIQSHDCYDSH